MKLYVAGKFQERAQVRVLMDKLETMGHTITFDWTGEEQLTRPDHPVGNVIDDVGGGKSADALVCRFINPLNYRGSLIELGVALGAGKKVFMIGHAVDSCLFPSHPLVQHFETELEFLSYVRQVL